MDNGTPLLFVSYSRENKEHKEILKEYLEGVYGVDVFIDTNMQGGEDFVAKIMSAIQRATVFVLLVSKGFLRSRFVRDTEIPAIQQRYKDEDIPVVPVILEHCAWQQHPFLKPILARPEDGTPLSSFSKEEQEAEWMKVVRHVANLARYEAENQRIRILIADDHEFAVRGLADIIQDSGDMAVAARCYSPREVEKEIRRQQIDVALLDMTWFRDREKGFHLVETIKRLSPNTRIIPISNYPELLDRAKGMGTFPLDKGFTIEALYDRIREVYGYSTDAAAIKVQFDSLSERETDVLKAMAEGLTDKEIAQRLSISHSTVKTHVANFVGKLGAKNRVHAAMLAKEANIV